MLHHELQSDTVRSVIGALLVCFMAFSIMAAFPWKSNCCCRTSCPMKRLNGMHCAERTCSMGRTETANPVTAGVSLSMVVLLDSTELAAPAAGIEFAALPPQPTLSRPSPPEPPPPRA